MSNYEDRLTALEQKVATLTHNLFATQSDMFTNTASFNRSVAVLNGMFSEQERALRDVHHEITILTGVIGSQGQDIKTLKEDMSAVKTSVQTLERNMNSRFEAQERNVNTRFEALEQNVNNRFETLEQSVNSRFEAQDKKLDQVLGILSALAPKPQQET